MALPENSVRSALSVENVVEKHLQLLVIVKVGGDDCADRRGSGKPSGRNVLEGRERAQAGLYQTLGKATAAVLLPGMQSCCPAGKVCGGRSSCHRRCLSFRRR